MIGFILGFQNPCPEIQDDSGLGNGIYSTEIDGLCENIFLQESKTMDTKICVFVVSSCL